MNAIAHLAQGIAARNLVGVEAAAAHEYIKRQQDVAQPGQPTMTPSPTSIDDAGAVSTLLSAYLSANPSLHTANAEIISLISSFALAQEAYNSALERGETPPPPVLALPASTGTASITAIPTNTASGQGTTNTMNGPGGNTAQPSTGSSANATRSLTSSAANNATGTGAAGKKYGGSGKMAIIALCGVIAVLALAA